MTLGWSVNSGGELTKPVTFTTRVTLSREPSSRTMTANSMRPVARA